MSSTLIFTINTPQAIRRVSPDAVFMPQAVVQLTVEELIDRNMKARSCRWVWAAEAMLRESDMVSGNV